MNILQINNYHYVKGGAERYYFEISDLLRNKGHEVFNFSVEDKLNEDSEQLKYFGKAMSFDVQQGILSKLKTAQRILYSFDNQKRMSGFLTKHSVDIAHAHNIYHRVSPSVLAALKKKGIPVVMTLHDYKLGCSIYTFYRDGHICTDCMNGKKYKQVFNKCTKGSLSLSFLHWVESVMHEALGIYLKNIDYFICPSQFLLRQHIEIGIPEEKLVHIPNFIDVNHFVPTFVDKNYLLFVGRLSSEKGVLSLIRAVKGLDVELKIVGDGPLKNELKGYAAQSQIDNVSFLGYQSGQDLITLFQEASCVVFPSEWYENGPMAILESFSFGKPVIGSNIGGTPEMIKDGETGLLFAPGDVEELRQRIHTIFSDQPLRSAMAHQAREWVEKRYNPEDHLDKVFSVYQKATEKHG